MLKCKIQFVLPSAGTAIMQPHSECTVEKLRIGRATSQHVFLSDPAVALEHASIVQEDGELILHVMADVGAEVNGKLTHHMPIKVGDVIAIGSFMLTLFAPERDYDLVLFVEQRAPAVSHRRGVNTVQTTTQQMQGVDEGSTKTRRLALRLADAGMSRRRWSWLAVWLVLALFLIAPVAKIMQAVPEPAASMMPGDVVWQTGEFSHVHRYFGRQCSSCHEVPFARVRNQACIHCHQQTFAHAGMVSSAAAEETELARQGRCGSCHVEHNGALSLRPQHSDFCASCHGHLRGGDMGLGFTSDFGSNHPEFRPTVKIDGAWQRIAVGNAGLQHRSGLKFAHDKHIVKAGVDSPNGKRVLQCGDCHEPEPGGAYLLPVRMEKHCQQCHQLNFDPAAPKRVVPHGDLPAVTEFLNEYYALQSLRGGYKSADAPPTISRRRRPSDKVSGQEQQSALVWAQDKALRTAREIVETRTCAVCHTVTADNSSIGWQLDPVEQPPRWLKLAFFDHNAHRSQACTDCHINAAASTRAEDVLMPGIESCRQCHGGALAKDRYASECTACHRFHLEGKPTYGEIQTDWMQEPQQWLQRAKDMIGM